MPHDPNTRLLPPPANRPRAPYRVYRGNEFAGTAATLEHLCQLLESLDQQDQAARQAFDLARAHALAHGAVLLDRRRAPRPRVVDARGLDRDDLRAPWAIRHHFNQGTKDAPRLAEFPWDAEVRPRGAPVPGTGGGARYGRCYLRYPRTQRERRQACPVMEDGEPLPRGSRRPHALPHAWDDLPRHGRQDRSWKRFRAAQWAARGKSRGSSAR